MNRPRHAEMSGLGWVGGGVEGRRGGRANLIVVDVDVCKVVGAHVEMGEDVRLHDKQLRVVK